MVNFPKRTPLSAVGVLVTCALLLLLTPFSAAKTVIPITGSFTLANQVINGNVYNVSSMTTSSNASLNYITECTIQGDGIGFTAFTSTVSNSKIALFNLTMAKTTVTNTTVQITGYFPPSSTLLISYTTATMQGTTPLYDLRGLVLENHVVMYFLETTATWNQGGGGGDVLLLGGSVRQLFQTYSGFYMVNTRATYAAHILHQTLPLCGVTYCLDVYSGLIAIDVATCVNCTGAFLQSDQTNRFLSGANGGVVRVSNCTSVGGQPFVKAATANTFEFSGNGNVIFYGITTDGVLFAKYTSLPEIKGVAYFSFMHINALSTGNTTSLPVDSGSNTIWAGNITLGGAYMNSLTTLMANAVTPKYFLDPYGTVIDSTGTSYYTETNGTAASVFCTRLGFSNVSAYEQLTGWKRAKCTCDSGTYGPYCTQSVDPISYYVNYNAANVGVVCSVPNCTTCLTTTTDQCTNCDPGFKLSGKLCVAKGCDATNCSSCVFDSEQNCSVCQPGYKLAQDNITCTPKVCQASNCSSCVFDSETACAVCQGNFKRGADNATCVAMQCNVPNCSTCVTENNTLCQSCSANYKLASNSTVCAQKVCQASNCSSCVFDSETACAVCQGNFKRDASNTTCVAMTCNASNCTTCVTEQNAVCQSCSANYKLGADGKTCTQMTCNANNCLKCVDNTEDECEVCEGNFKRGADNATCVSMQCKARNCSVCVTEKDTLCEVCDNNFKRSADNTSCVPMQCNVQNCASCLTEQRATCNKCEGNYKLNSNHTGCVSMACRVSNCNVCVTENETKCETCGSGFEVSPGGGCASTQPSSGLATSAIVGIVVGIVGALLLLLLGILLFLFCKNRRISASEDVPPELRGSTDAEMVRKADGEKDEDMDRASQSNPMERRDQNPLMPPPSPPSSSGPASADGEMPYSPRSRPATRLSMGSIRPTTSYLGIDV